MIELKVSDSRQSDVARGIGRIDQKNMEKLGVKAGDAIEIYGAKSTAIIAWPAYSEDQDKGVIRIDGFARKNAGTSINETVNVKPAKAKNALNITLEPEEMHLNVDQDFVSFVKNRLIGRVFVNGDSTLIMLIGHPVLFIVTKTDPNGIVKITFDTDLIVNSGPVAKTASEIEGVKHRVSQWAKHLQQPFHLGKRDNTVMTRLSNEDLQQIDLLIGTGLFESRSEAVAYLTHEGIISKREMFNHLSNKFKLIAKIKDEAKALLGTSAPTYSVRVCPNCRNNNSPTSKFCSSCGEELGSQADM
jgi:hypothetical protein